MADANEFFRRLTELFELPPESGRPETEIGEGDMDSLRTLDLIALIDETLGVTVASNELAACRTLGAIWDLATAAVDEQAGTGPMERASDWTAS